MHKACKSPKGSAISSVFCNLHGRKNRPKKLTKKKNRYKYRIGKISVRSGPRSPLPKVTMSKRQLISSEEDTDEGKVAKIGDTDHDENTAHNNMAVATPAKTGKRTDYLSWDEYFMAVAFLSAQRSKDPNSQVGACVVNPERKIVGIGYNGMPNGCSDDELPWARQAESNLETKYPYVCHAELNAILNKNAADIKGCSIYVALFPCNECTKLIIQAGIKEVIYYSDKYHDQPNCKASRRLLNMAKITYRQFKPRKCQIVIDFTSIDGFPSKRSLSVASP